MSERIEFKTQALRPASFFWVYYTCLCVCAYAHVGVRMAEYEYRSRCGGCRAVGIVMTSRDIYRGKPRMSFFIYDEM